MKSRYFIPAIDAILGADPAQLLTERLVTVGNSAIAKTRASEMPLTALSQCETQAGNGDALTMAEIVDFQSKRSEFLRRKADKYAEISRHHAARLGWLQQNGAGLAEQVRASLEASKADGDFRQMEQTLLRYCADGGLCS